MSKNQIFKKEPPIDVIKIILHEIGIKNIDNPNEFTCKNIVQNMEKICEHMDMLELLHPMQI